MLLFLAEIGKDFFKIIQTSGNKDVVRWALGDLEGGGVNCFLEKHSGSMKYSWIHNLLEKCR